MQEFRTPMGDLMQKFYQAEGYDKLRKAMDVDQQAEAANGNTLVRRIRVGRNQPCPCGSRRKFKKCCINKVQRV